MYWLDDVPVAQPTAMSCELPKWGFAQSPSCDYGQRQTMNHIVDTCPLTQFEGGLNLLHEADDGAVIWLDLHCESPNSCPQLHQILTDFQNSFTVRLSRKFVTKSYVNTPNTPQNVSLHYLVKYMCSKNCNF